MNEQEREMAEEARQALLSMLFLSQNLDAFQDLLQGKLVPACQTEEEERLMEAMLIPLNFMLHRGVEAVDLIRALEQSSDSSSN